MPKDTTTNIYHLPLQSNQNAHKLTRLSCYYYANDDDDHLTDRSLKDYVFLRIASLCVVEVVFALCKPI